MAITTGNHFVYLSFVFWCLPQECRLNQLNFRPFSSALLQLRQNPLQSKGNKIHEKAYLLVPQWWCYTLWDSLKESKLRFICPISKWPYFMAEIEPSNFYFSCQELLISKLCSFYRILQDKGPVRSEGLLEVGSHWLWVDCYCCASIVRWKLYLGKIFFLPSYYLSLIWWFNPE